LEHALQAFVDQKYDGVKELIVLNSCPQQHLKFSWSGTNATVPNIRFVNLTRRPKTLGECRNIAISDARGDIIVIWDDDDYFLPHHLRSIADGFAAAKPDRSPPMGPKQFGVDWIWLTRQFWGWGDTIKDIVRGQCPCFAFTKRAWLGVGGYPTDLSVGEDRTFISRVTQSFPGNYSEVTGMPSFIYRWDNGVYHMSGQGDDKPDQPQAYDRYWADVQKRFNSASEPMGDVTVIPQKPDVDWLKLAEDFMARESKKNSMNDVCVIYLERYGDIINILPILLHIHNEFKKPFLMVNKHFANLLDGVSYVTPFVVDYQTHQLNEAIAFAKTQFKDVICAQIYGGPQYAQERLCPSYNMEAWRVCGFLHKFTDPSWRPLFDRRDTTAERSLVSKASSDKPTLLVNVTHASSSPFNHGPDLLKAIQESLQPKFNIVDIGGLKLPHVYDLLGLMENAGCLVSIDTVHLHLAAAVPKLPVVALTNHGPWVGTISRRPSINITYAEAATDFARVINSIVNAVAGDSTIQPIAPSNPPERRLFHCVERHSEPHNEQRNRKATAWTSWKTLYDAGVIPCTLYENEYPRSAFDIGERRHLPYLKDVLARGMRQATPDDIIFFTNDDNVLHPELPEMLRYHVSLYECCSSQRCEFRDISMPALDGPPAAFAKTGNLNHMGRDLLAFTKRWLEAHWEEIPDFILGCSDWDLCLAALIRNHFKIRTTRQNLEHVMFPAEIPRGYIAHSFHDAHWNRPDYINKAPGQLYNRTLFMDWAKTHAPHLKFDGNLCI
jgi:glycosyltransferase involved in cell wall biosynthesis